MLRETERSQEKGQFLEADLTGELLAVSKPTAVVPGGIYTRKVTTLYK